MPQPTQPTPGDRLRVVQCNILHGGWPYEIRGRQLFVDRAGAMVPQETDFTPRSYPPANPLTDDPGSNFAGLMQPLQPDVIGMQEVDGRDLGRLKGLLGPDWQSTPPLAGNAASCIFWDSSRVTQFEKAEVGVVQNYVNPAGDTIPIRVLKQVFVHAASQKKFAVATGKSWYQGSQNDRKLRAAHTRDFARRGGLTTMVAIDMSPPGSPAFKEMAPFVAKGTEPTCPAGIFAGRQGAKPVRNDHVFYFSPALGARQRDGIVECRTGPFFGSDHLFVWADVELP
jgi:hypothetical protein